MNRVLSRHVAVPEKGFREHSSNAKWDIGFASDDMCLCDSMTRGWHINFMKSIYASWDGGYAQLLLKRFGLRAERLCICNVASATLFNVNDIKNEASNLRNAERTNNLCGRTMTDSGAYAAKALPNRLIENCYDPSRCRG